MICLITGSSRGLGRAVALAFGAEGHKVIVHYRERKEDAEAVVSRIDDSYAFKADVRVMAEVKVLVNDVISRWGRIDVLVNNAGITKEALLIKTSGEEFDDVVSTNLKGPFNFIQTAGRYMMKQKGGHIINISSYTGLKGGKGLSAYSASKAGLIGLTKTAAKEFARYNISVNAVLPGYMLTHMGTDAAEKAKESALNDNLLRKFSDPVTIAAFICNLTKTKGVSGQVFNLDSRII